LLQFIAEKGATNNSLAEAMLMKDDLFIGAQAK
jgi:hypothetical protein